MAFRRTVPPVMSAAHFLIRTLLFKAHARVKTQKEPQIGFDRTYNLKIYPKYFLIAFIRKNYLMGIGGLTMMERYEDRPIPVSIHENLSAAMK